MRGRRRTVLAGSLRGDWGLSGSDLSGTQPRFCEYTSTLLALVLDLGPRYPGVFGEKLRKRRVCLAPRVFGFRLV